MPTDRSAGDADGWATAWVTRAIAAELPRPQPFGFRWRLVTADPGKLLHTGTWAHFLIMPESCVAAQTRQDLGVANVEVSRRSSGCDAFERTTTAGVSLIHKLQVRLGELIDNSRVRQSS